MYSQYTRVKAERVYQRVHARRRVYEGTESVRRTDDIGERTNKESRGEECTEMREVVAYLTLASR